MKLYQEEGKSIKESIQVIDPEALTARASEGLLIRYNKFRKMKKGGHEKGHGRKSLVE